MTRRVAAPAAGAPRGQLRTTYAAGWCSDFVASKHEEPNEGIGISILVEGRLSFLMLWPRTYREHFVLSVAVTSARICAPMSFSQMARAPGPKSSRTDTSSLFGPNASVARKYCSFQPQRRILLVMSQRNVCYIVLFYFSSRRDTEPTSTISSCVDSGHSGQSWDPQE